MKTELTLKDITPELTAAVGRYLRARATAQVLRLNVNQIGYEILEDNPLPHTDRAGKPAPIYDPGRVWLCEDTAATDRYYAELDARLRHHQIKPADMPSDYCPALVAEAEQLKAEWAIIEATGRMLEIDAPDTVNNRLLCLKDGLQKREQYIDAAVTVVLAAGL